MLGKVCSQLNRATELCEDGKYLEALKCYDEVLCAEPNNTDAIINKGVILQNLGHLKQAIHMYEKALIFLQIQLFFFYQYLFAWFEKF